jgi:predicted N-acetyltransferase YhbS
MGRTMQISLYSGPDDLRRMQTLVQRTWSLNSRWHVGDLAWGRYSVPSPADECSIALWLDDAEPIAWGWLEQPGHLEWCVEPERPEVAADVLAWSDKVTHTDQRTCTVLETESHLTSALDAHGFAPQLDLPFFTHHHRRLESLAEPQLPDGFALTTVSAAAADRRAACHRAAWSDLRPSNVSAESYADVMRAWPYRSELDWVVEAPDGEWVSSALGWIDEQNRVGLLEPVGCAPSYRRLGLARAVNLATLRALRTAGADTALVCPRGDDAYPVPAKLYQSIGFEPDARTITYVRQS